MPNATPAAFQNHGPLRASLEEDVDTAYRHLAKLAALGIDLDHVTRELEIASVLSPRSPAGGI